MKRLVLLCISSAIAGGAWAQCALDLQSRAQLRHATMSAMARESAARFKKAQSPTAEGRSFGFVEVTSQKDIEAFIEAGGEVLSRRGNILLTSMPTSGVMDICALPGMKRVQLSRPVYQKLDSARILTGVDKIHAGIDLPQAYTGKGVVAGIVDGGMDPNHVNFKDADGNPRIKHFTYIRPNAAGNEMLASFYTPDQLSSFSTDDDRNYHGTHTMGIMAGSYRGNLKVGDGRGGLTTVSNPYYGMAPDSEIAASCGQLNDMFIAYGIEYIVQYAEAQKKPVVINLSLGSNLGTHDGRNVMSQYLDAISSQANVLFCVAAGNEGDINIALNKTLTADDTEVKTFLRPTAFGEENKFARYGQVQIYSDSEEVFDTQVVVYNKTRGRIAFRMPVKGVATAEGTGAYWASSDDYKMSATDIVSPELAKYFEGYVGVGCYKDPDTGRFMALVDLMTYNNMTYNADNNYLMGIVVNGKDGQRIDFFGDGLYQEMTSYDIEGWQTGGPDGSISDMACTKSALVVGSYNNRDNWYSLDGNLYGFEGMFAQGKVSQFSSWGTLVDGRELPHLCAPGATLISSTSNPFVYNADNGITPEYLQGETAEGTQAFFEQMAGTSMATPAVAGAIALWLEADPSLFVDDIKEIAIQTAVRDADVEADPRRVKWGAGKFDAYAGLKEVLRRKNEASVADVSDSRPMLSMKGARTVEVFMAGAAALDVSVFDLSGRAVLSHRAAGDETVIDCSSLASGVYMISVNGKSLKIAIK